MNELYCPINCYNVRFLTIFTPLFLCLVPMACLLPSFQSSNNVSFHWFWVSPYPIAPVNINQVVSFTFIAPFPPLTCKSASLLCNLFFLKRIFNIYMLRFSNVERKSEYCGTFNIHSNSCQIFFFTWSNNMNFLKFWLFQWPWPYIL
jgi:hypothetical protein